MAQIPVFDPSTVTPREDFSPIPAGEYVAHITDSEMKATKNGAGQYLEITFEITEGSSKGRKVWSRLNLDNPNTQTVEIAYRDLGTIAQAVGHKGPITDTQVLHYKPLVIRVVEVPADAKRSTPGNEIKAYKAPAGGTVSANSPGPAPAASASPWPARKAS